MDRSHLAGAAVLGAAAGVAAHAYLTWWWKRPKSTEAPLIIRTKSEPLQSDAKPVVIAGPGLEEFRATLQTKLGAEEFDDVSASFGEFGDGAPWLFYNWRRIIGRKVYYLFETVDKAKFVDQIALLQALQGFPVPDAADVATEFKNYVDEGTYNWGRAAEVTVILPWYRYCRAERTSKFDKPQGTKSAEGEWNEVPTALYIVRALCSPGSVPPPPGPKGAFDGRPLTPLWRPPLKLLFLDIHEEKPVRTAVSDLQVTMHNAQVIPYFVRKFVDSTSYPGPGSTYILFPDEGQFKRSKDLCAQEVPFTDDHILFMPKTRVGPTEIKRKEVKLFFRRSSGETLTRTSKFTADDHILLCDDLTNTGSTLFQVVDALRDMYIDSGSSPSVHMFVSHFQANYDAAKVAQLQKRVHGIPNCRFITTNSLPFIANLLKGDPRFEVLDICDIIADYVLKS